MSDQSRAAYLSAAAANNSWNRMDESVKSIASQQTLLNSPPWRYAMAVTLSGAFGWMLGVAGLLDGEHWQASSLSASLAVVSLVAFTRSSAIWSLARTRMPFSVRGWPAGGGVSMRADEPSHIHIPRPSKGAPS